MKSRYKRNAWYLDEDILIHGYVDKRGFHPEKGIECGFGIQKVLKKQKNRIWFYSIGDAINALGPVRTVGGRAIVSMDLGMSVTKIFGAIGDTKENLSEFQWKVWHRDSDFSMIKDSGQPSGQEIAEVIAAFLFKAGIVETHQMLVNVGVIRPIGKERESEEGEYSVSYEGNEYNFLLKIVYVRPNFGFSFR